MKPGMHPRYGPVVFRDRSAGSVFLTRSTATSTQTVAWEDGHTYPVIDVEISAASHPFWAGKAREFSGLGRVARFQRRYGRS